MSKIQQILLILSLLFVTINTTPITDCNSSATDVTIEVGTTTGVSTWDNIVTCLTSLTASDGTITALTIIIDGNVTTKTNALDLSGNAKFASSYTLDIQISNSDLTATELGTNLYTPINADISSISSIKLTLDVAPLLADLLIIENWLSNDKLDNTSAILFSSSASQACVITDQDTLDGCLVHTADQTAVSNCDDTFLIYTELTLTSTVPSDVNTCLGVIDQSGNGGKLAKLTIDYTGATTVAAGNLDFDTLLTNRKILITDLNVNLKNTTFKNAPVITDVFSGLQNLTLNYCNNGLNGTTTQSLAYDLEFLARIPQNKIELIMTDSLTDSNILGNFINIYVVLQNNQSVESNIQIFYLDQMCTQKYFAESTCDIIHIHVEKEFSPYELMNCDGDTFKIETEKWFDLEDVQITGNYVVKPPVPAWDTILNSITTVQDEIELPLTNVPLDSYKFSFQITSAKIGNNNVVYKDGYTMLDIFECLPEANILMNGDFYSDVYNCPQLQYIFTIDEQNITRNGKITSDTTFKWELIDYEDNILSQSTEKSFLLNLDQYGNFMLELTIENPDIFVSTFSVYSYECPGLIQLNGDLVEKKYSNCEDLKFTIIFPEGVEPDQQTQYNWNFKYLSENYELQNRERQDILESISIDDTLNQVTIPKSDLIKAGKYLIELDTNIVDVNSAIFEIELSDNNCQEDEKKEEDYGFLITFNIVLIQILLTIF